ncbi:MAG TPA: hypothetical protein VG942_11570 [Hyphomonadaceae bacterium]|nr:hypothetical protein [Hyphomonadaceae bacterium]
MKRAVGLVSAGLGLLALAGCFNVGEALNDKPNVGPCPVSGSLYDASRVVEVKGAQRHENVGFTGAIEGVRGFCRYTGTNPITMEIEIDFEFGKGPKADGAQHNYPYFVTVTRRDRSVLAKEVYQVPITFPAGKDIVKYTEKLDGIEIPRANDTVSGSNFEVIVGFDLTPEQLAYNRSGTRFLMNVDKPATPQVDKKAPTK